MTWKIKKVLSKRLRPKDLHYNVPVKGTSDRELHPPTWDMQRLRARALIPWHIPNMISSSACHCLTEDFSALVFTRCGAVACERNREMMSRETELFHTCSTVTGLGIECPLYASRFCSFIFRTERLLALEFWFSFFKLGLALKLRSAFAFIKLYFSSPLSITLFL